MLKRDPKTARSMLYPLELSFYPAKGLENTERGMAKYFKLYSFFTTSGGLSQEFFAFTKCGLEIALYERKLL
jgi:hypothetical protein